MDESLLRATSQKEPPQKSNCNINLAWGWSGTSTGLPHSRIGDNPENRNKEATLPCAELSTHGYSESRSQRVIRPFSLETE